MLRNLIANQLFLFLVKNYNKMSSIEFQDNDVTELPDELQSKYFEGADNIISKLNNDLKLYKCPYNNKIECEMNEPCIKCNDFLGEEIK